MRPAPQLAAGAVRKRLCHWRGQPPNATRVGRRELPGRGLLDGLTLEPERREIEIRVKLPTYAL